MAEENADLTKNPLPIDQPPAEGAPPTPDPAEQYEEKLQGLVHSNMRNERRVRELLDKVRSLEETNTGLGKKAEQMDSFQKALANNDMDALTGFGVDIKKLIDGELEKPSPEQQRFAKLEKAFEELSGKLSERDKREAELEKAAEQARGQQARLSELKYVDEELIGKAEGEALAYTKILGGQSDIVERFHAETKRLRDETGDPQALADESKVAAKVELQLEKLLTEQLGGLLKTEKFRKLIEKVQSGLGESQGEKRDDIQAILNADLSGGSPGGKKQLSEDEWRQEALRAAEAAFARTR